MSSPGDETAAGAERHARLRASGADREQVIEVLKAAFVQDRITKDELEQRIGKVLASRTYDDLDVLTADIPAGPTETRRPEHARKSHNRKVIQRGTAAGAGASMAFTAVLVMVIVAEGGPAIGLVAVPVVGSVVAVLLAGLLTLIKWVLDRSSARQPSQGPPPGTRDNAAEDPVAASLAAQSRQIGHRMRPGAEAARSCFPRSPSAGLRSPQRLQSLTTSA